jgi:general secretion pathway protein K
MTGIFARLLGRYLANDRGVALIIVVFVVALVTVLVLEYHYDAAVELELAANFGSDMQAYHLAMSGLSFAQVLLRQDDAEVDGPGDLWYQLTVFPVCFPPEQLIAMATSTEEGGVLSPGGLPERVEERDAAEKEAEDQEPVCVSLRIVDEERKLPLNRLRPAADAGEPDPTWFNIFERFFELMQIDLDRLDALIDWIDSDHDPRPGLGAERSYYEGLESPYTPSNRALQTPAELRLVRGFDAETLAKLFPGTEPEAMADVDVGTNAYLTSYGSLQTGEDAAQQGAKVNLNTANAEVLQALLSGLQGGSSSADAVEQILVRREEEPFESVSDVGEIAPEAADLESVASVSSSFFRVESAGVVGPIRKRVVAILQRSSQNLKMIYFKVE